jgi:hypothetical protein
MTLLTAKTRDKCLLAGSAQMAPLIDPVVAEGADRIESAAAQNVFRKCCRGARCAFIVDPEIRLRADILNGQTTSSQTHFTRGRDRIIAFGAAARPKAIRRRMAASSRLNTMKPKFESAGSR